MSSPSLTSPSFSSPSMTSPLNDAISRARRRVEDARSRLPIEEIQRRVASTPRPRNFFRALVELEGESPFRIIAELPAARAFEGGGPDPVEVARRYHRAGASALCCRTDPAEDGLDASWIARIRESVPLPVLRRQLVVDAYDLWESRLLGADAVVLVAEALTEGSVIDFQILASELGMTSIIEVSDEWNLLRVIAHVGFPHASGCLVAIDNQDSETGGTDLAVSTRLAELVEGRRVLVSEGGIRTPRDVARLRHHGFHLALIGRGADAGEVEATLRRLLQSS